MRSAPLLLTLVVGTACHREPAQTRANVLEATATVAAPPSTSTSEADAREPRAPISGFFESLAVPGHPDAWLSLPTGASEPRPVVVVIHGSGDRPDWQCGGWRQATGGFAFVICPRGAYSPSSSTKSDARYTLAGGAPLLAHIDAALVALALRYGDYADTRTPLLAGFSLGAWEVLGLAVQAPERFPRVALIEGGMDGWSDQRIMAFRGGGGKRVLLGCGQRYCEVAGKATANRLSRSGIEARVVFAPVDHTFDLPLENAVHAELGWLLAGDARWDSRANTP